MLALALPLLPVLPYCSLVPSNQPLSPLLLAYTRPLKPVLSTCSLAALLCSPLATPYVLSGHRLRARLSEAGNVAERSNFNLASIQKLPPF